MKILIIGSEGFIGAHCVDHFAANNNEVWGLDLFEQVSSVYHYIKVSRLSPEFEEVFRQQRFDAVINAAGSGSVSYSMSHPLSDFEANCLDTIRILDVIRKHQPECKYIHLSSAAVYGNPVKLPVQESDPTIPMSAYGWHKLISEQICREYNSVYSLKIAILRPFSVYGKGLKKQLFWDIYQKYLAGKGRIELFGTGKESRDFIHVTDMIKGMELIINKGPLKAESYNLASGKEISIESVATIFFEAIGTKPSYFFNGKVRDGDPRNWRADINQLTNFGFKTTVDLNSGLQETVNWMKLL